MKKFLLLFLILSLTLSMISCSLFKKDEPDPVEPGTDGGGTTNPGENGGDGVTAGENIINVYLIAGQSNAVGYGMDTNNKIANSDSRFKNGFENVLYYGDQERWSGGALNEEFQPVTLNMGVASNRSGAEIGIASAIADNGEMNAIIKCAQGATHLYPDTLYNVSLEYGTWTPPSYIAKHNVDMSANPLIGYMYTRFVDTVTSGLELLIADGYTPVIKGVWWMQGEAEMFTTEMSSAYKELYETLISDVRNMLSEVSGYDCSNTPFICGLPKWNTKNSPAPAYQTAVRNAMMTVAQQMENVGYVDCMPLTQHDDWHFDAAGQKYLGEQFVVRLRGFDISAESGFDAKVSIDKDVKLLVNERGLEFRANLTQYNDGVLNEYGFIIVPTYNLINIKSDYIAALNQASAEYRQIVCDVQVDEIDEDYSDIYFTCRLANVEYDDLTTDFTAIAYVKNPDGEYMYSSKYASASVAGLASRELYKTGANKAEIQKIVNAGINYSNGMSEDDAEADPDFDLITVDNINLALSETVVEYQLIVNKSVNVDYFIKYSSADSSIASVDENGVIKAHKLGSTKILVECAGKTHEVPVTVKAFSKDGVTLDGVISSGEYVGNVISASNSTLSAKFSGMIKNGNLYMSFELTHGAWSSLQGNWWDNDNIEFKLNNGLSYKVVFYEGVPEYSSNITYGVSKTVEKNGKLVTTVELCVEGVDPEYQLKVGFNGKKFGWLGALWPEIYNTTLINSNGIVNVGNPIDHGNGLVLDGVFNESVYTSTVKSNAISATANGASVSIMGTLIEDGVLFGVTVNHTKAPGVSTDGGSDWYKYMNIEFRFNGNAANNGGFISTTRNETSLGMLAYCKSVQTSSGYTSTFEIFIPFEAIGVSSNTTSLDFTASGWFESGWCWMLNNSWAASHTVSKNGIAKK